MKISDKGFAFIYYIIFAFMYFVVYNIYYMNHYLAGIIMISYSVVQYIVIANRKKTLINLKAIFMFTWCGTMGLCFFQLLGYQFIWQSKIFAAEFIGISCILLGLDLGRILVRREKKNDINDLTYKFNRNLYNTVLFLFGIAILCYFLNYVVVGFIPLIQRSSNAYYLNTSKFMTIEVGLAPISGIAYYCTRCKGIGHIRKYIMWFVIVVNTFMFPILNVSRGNLVANICMFLPAVYFFSKNRKKTVIRVAVCAVIGIVLLTSVRGFDNAYEGLEIQTVNIGDIQFTPSDDIAMSYAYLTCSHDNFALNINTYDDYTYGLRMFQILNECLDIESADQALRESRISLYWVNSFLNTHDMIGFFYYDIGYVGIIVWGLLWGTLWGLTEKVFQVRNSPVASIVYGITLYSLALAFFSSKTGFVVAMWYGTTYLCFEFSKLRITIGGGNGKKRLFFDTME